MSSSPEFVAWQFAQSLVMSARQFVEVLAMVAATKRRKPGTTIEHHITLISETAIPACLSILGTKAKTFSPIDTESWDSAFNFDFGHAEVEVYIDTGKIDKVFVLIVAYPNVCYAAEKEA